MVIIGMFVNFSLGKDVNEQISVACFADKVDMVFFGDFE